MKTLQHAGRTGDLPLLGIGQHHSGFKAASFTKGKRAQPVVDGARRNAGLYIR